MLITNLATVFILAIIAGCAALLLYFVLNAPLYFAAAFGVILYELLVLEQK